MVKVCECKVGIHMGDDCFVLTLSPEHSYNRSVDVPIASPIR